MKSDNRILRTVLDIFYPKSCVICGGFINYGKDICICSDCLARITKYEKVIRDNSKYFQEAVAALPYEKFVRDSMTDYKFRAYKYYAKTFAYSIYNKISNRDFIKDISVICPIPLHPMRDREYNQSEIIADELEKMISIRHIPDLLIKTRNLAKFSKMNYSMRKASSGGSMQFNMKYNIKGQTIAIIDDIYTTGTTVNEASRILKMHGAAKVYVFTACYAVEEKKGDNNYADANNIAF